MGDAGDAAALLAAQQRFFRSGGSRALEHRQNLLERLKAALIEEQANLERALHTDLGMPESEAVTGELGLVVGEITRHLRTLRRASSAEVVATPKLLWPGKSRVVPEPFGPVLVLSPYNAPLQLSLVPAVAALAAGNTVVLKPSEYAAAISLALRDLVNTHFEREAFHVVLGAAEYAERLSALPFSYVFFTGSTSVGRKVYQAAAANLCPVTLELGGRNPCVVRQDANIAVSARRIAFGKFYNAGQTCVAPNAVYVHHSRQEELLSALKPALEQLYGADPAASPDYGRIVNAQHVERLQELLKGVTVVYGGQSEPDERYFAPTVVKDVAEHSVLLTDEVFGPILPLVPYGDESELDVHLERCATPLALYIFTEDRRAAERLRSRHPAGGCVVNDTMAQVMNPNLPFGGVGTSGLGSYRGRLGARAFTRNAAVVERSTRVDLPLRYPPHSAQAKRAMRRALR